MICIKLILLHRRKGSPSVSLKCIKEYKSFFYGCIGECYEPENKRKCTGPERESMSGDLMELNDTELNYINFGDETDSDNTTRMKTLCFKKACSILNSLAEFKLLRVFKSESFCTRKYILYFRMSSFYGFLWLKRFFIFA